MKTELEQIRIRSNTKPGKAAGYIVERLAETGETDIRAIGPKAISQAAKAIAIARDMAAEQDADIAAYPNFVDADVDGQKYTALRFYLVAIPLRMEDIDGQD